MKRCLVCFGLVFGFVACETQAPAPAPKTYDLSPALESAPSVGPVRGVVVDESGAAIPSATVTIGTTATTSDAAGRFQLTAPTGRALLTVNASDRVALTRTLGVTSQSPYLRLTLAKRSPDQVVPGGKAAKIAARDATLEFDTSAFTKETKVSATWLATTELAAMSGRAILSEGGKQRRMLGQLHVEAEAQPGSPVGVSVPGVPDLPEGTELALYTLIEGELTESVPNVGTNERPKFLISHFSDYVFVATLPEVNIGYAKTWVLQVTSGVVTDGSGREYHSGDRVAPGTTLRGNFTIWAPIGAQVQNDGAPLRVDTDDDGSTSATCIELCRAHVEVKPVLLQGSIQTGRPRMVLRTRFGVAVGVRGTVFRFEEKNCSEASKTHLVWAEVSEGAADFDMPGYSTRVSAGKQARACEGCADPRSTTCDCDPIACDHVGGKCLKCADGIGHGKLLPDSPFCVPADATCCEGKARAFAGLCSETTDGKPLCQCRGEEAAGCATANSRCVDDLERVSGKKVLDCGLDASRSIQCFHREGGGETAGPHWSCDRASDYATDRNNCGACGHQCTGKQEICYEGTCVDCNNNCGDSKVWCPNLGKCCTFPATGPFSTTCVVGPDSVAPGCPPQGYLVTQGATPGTCQ